MHYPNMKASKIDWLGDIPQHWDVKRVKDISYNLGNGKYGDEPELKLYNIPCISISDFKHGNLIDTHAIKLARSYDTYNFLNKGTILIEKSGGGEKLLVGRNILVKNKICSYYTNFVQAIKPKINASYMSYMFNAIHINRFHLSYIKQNTGLQNFDFTAFQNAFCCPVPVTSEQTAIANFLDLHTTKIDRNVSLLEQKVERLEEYRQALIYETVTRGLNPDVKMKASGVDWIGDIPDHWEVSVLNRIVNSICTGTKNTEDDTENGIYPLYVRSKKIRSTNTFSHNGEAVLIPGEGNIGDIFHYVNGKFDYHQRVYKVSNFKHNTYGKYIYYWFNAYFKFYSDSKSQKVTVDSLRLPTFLKFFVALSSKAEQTAIAHYLDSATAKIDKKVELLKQKIGLLKEYKQSLIYEAVTGKLDVTAQA